MRSDAIFSIFVHSAISRLSVCYNRALTARICVANRVHSPSHNFTMMVETAHSFIISAFESTSINPSNYIASYFLLKALVLHIGSNYHPKVTVTNFIISLLGSFFYWGICPGLTTLLWTKSSDY